MSLHLTHLKVEQLRQFRQPFALTGLQAGLNIVAGPNEAGKSTLVRAIRAAFFERYRSKVVEDLRPWGDSGASPMVDIGFMLDGQVGSLVKTFLGSKARCDLQIGSARWAGADAEDHLSQLLGFGFAAKGASRSEHWGIPGLLWVEQGSGQELADAAAHARSHLHQALHSHIGASSASALSATGGDAVLAQVQAQRDLLLTGTGRAKGALADAMERVDTLRAQCQTLSEQVSQYRLQVDELARLRAAHQADEAQRPWEALRTRLQATQLAQREAEQARQQCQDARLQHQQLVQQHALLLRQLGAFEQQAQEEQVRLQAQVHAQAALQQAEAELAQAQQQSALAQGQADRAMVAWRAAQQVAQRQQLQAQLRDATEACSRAQAGLQRAREAAEHLSGAQASAAGARLTPADLQTLRKLDRQAHEARVRRQDHATRIQFALLPGQGVSLRAQGADEALTGHGERMLVEAATLHVPGVGDITVLPGGDDLLTLNRQHDAAQTQLADALRHFGVAGLVEAEDRAAQQASQAQQIELARQALLLVAPQGLAAWQSEIDRSQAQRQQVEVALSQLPEGEASAAQPEQTAPSLPVAEAAQGQATRAVAVATEALQQAQARRAAASAEHEAAERELRTVRKQLQDPENTRQQAEARAQLLQVGVARDARLQQLQQLEAVLSSTQVEILTQELHRLQRSLDLMLQDHQQRAMDIRLLEQMLAQAGAQGVEEALASAQTALADAERRQRELRLRADALALLRTRLEAKRQAALQHLQAPLQQHLQRYLSLLFPGAAVSVNDELLPTTLTRRSAGGAAESGAFDALSFGAREQLALVSRFAYADLLREAGQPTLIILDDALVHSDAQRLDAMKRVVFDAAQRHQLLLFSCHPEAWRDMGVPIRSIAARPSGAV